ncbi:MAG: type II toxin-antitoxin system RelE/ParE family toxin [Pseudomonadota bacterium]
MIRDFRHKGLERFFLTGKTAGIQPAHAARLRRQLSALNEASAPQAMNIPGWRLHRLKGDLKDHWSVWVSGNWRMTFTFEGPDAILVDYRDYH